MKHPKISRFAVLAAMAVVALIPGTASATTFAVDGIPINKPAEFTASLKSETETTWKTTSGALHNTCLEATLTGTSTTFTAAKVTGSAGLSFSNCFGFAPTVHKAGHLVVEFIKGSPGFMDGTVFLENTEVTVPGPFGSGALPCKTVGTGDIGTLTGVGHWAATEGVKHATLHVNTVLNCTFFAPSIVWEATYTVTSPTGFGIVP